MEQLARKGIVAGLAVPAVLCGATAMLLGSICSWVMDGEEF